MTRQSIIRVFGELVVIVAGVLIALSTDAWFETLKEQAAEEVGLVALRADFEASLKHLAESDSARAEILVALKRLTEEDLTQFPVDSVARLVYEGLFQVGRVEPRLSSMRAIEATDRLQLFSLELQTEISELNRVVRLVQKADEDLIRTQQDLVDPFLIARLSLGQAFADFDSLDVSLRSPSSLDVGALMSDEAQSMAVFKLSIAKIGTPRRHDLHDQLELLVGLTTRRLAELGSG